MFEDEQNITECFVFVDFYPDYTEPGSSHVDLIVDGDLFVRKQLKGAGLYERA